MPGNWKDRKTYLAIAGQTVSILTSDPTGEVGRVLKDLIKPPLRLIGILPPDTTPEFISKKKQGCLLRR